MDPRNPIVEEIPPGQRAALLPVEELKQLRLDERVEYTFKEFRLQGKVESLKDFVDLCFLKNGKRENNRIVWITENAFVRLGFDFELPGDYRSESFRLALARDGSLNQYLCIHFSTTEEAIAALDLLVGLQDSYFKKIQLQYFDRENDSNGQLQSAH
jgi:hypothetical protein